MNTTILFEPNEIWWGGDVADGDQQPFAASSVYSADYRVQTGNQAMPLFLSDHGRYIWSDEPFRVQISDGQFTFAGGEIQCVSAGSTLREAYRAAMQAHFPFNGKVLPREFFRTAQYNTWMEFTYSPTQAGVLDYARQILAHGFKPGILIIDEGWHGRYGDWKFDAARFPDPKAMVDELHRMGFIVMLWVVPWVCADGRAFLQQTYAAVNRKGNADRMFVRNARHEIGIFHWWNGYSALLDLANPDDAEFLEEQLNELMSQYGIDGFKFDGGNVHSYTEDAIINGPLPDGWNPQIHNRAWFDFGTRYKFHEFKDSYGCGGLNCIQRLRDRGHRWDGDGINSLIPSSIVQGLTGHPFICPDMIGGGEWSYNEKPGFHVDAELFIRMAQVSALCPMMQFSWAPWRVLSEDQVRILRDAAELHERMADELIALIKESEQSGEPVLRNLEYNDPHQGYAQICDEYMIGRDLLVAPVVTPQTRVRSVTFPAGIWQDEAGHIWNGRTVAEVAAPLEKLLWFRRVR